MGVGNQFIIINVFHTVYYRIILLRVRKTCPLIEKEKCTPQHVVTVEMNAKYHSNQKKTDLFTAKTASKTTNLHQDKVGVDLAEDPAALAEIGMVLDLVEETTDHVKCMM